MLCALALWSKFEMGSDGHVFLAAGNSTRHDFKKEFLRYCTHGPTHGDVGSAASRDGRLCSIGLALTGL
eukprot:s2413_g27.t1